MIEFILILNQIQQKGDVGSKGFMTGLPREVTLRTLSHCTFAYITIDDFLQTIKAFPADYEKFCMLKDSMVLYENESQSKLHCFSCQKSGHGVMNCAQIHLRKSNELIIQRHLFSPQQQREKYKRARQKIKLLTDLDVVRHELKSYRLDVIQSVKKDEDEIYEELMIKKDKEFFLDIECFSYNKETKAYILDPKEDYLYPDDDEEDDIDELDEEDESNYSQSDYQGTLLLENVEKQPGEQSQPEFIRKKTRQQSTNQGQNQTQGKGNDNTSKKRVSYNIESFTNLQLEPNYGPITPNTKSPNDKEITNNFFNKPISKRLIEAADAIQKPDFLRKNILMPQRSFKVQLRNDTFNMLSGSKPNLEKLEKKQKQFPQRQITSQFQQKEINNKLGLVKSKTTFGLVANQNQNNNNNNNNQQNNNSNINNIFNSIGNSNNIKLKQQQQQQPQQQMQYKNTFEQAPILKIENSPKSYLPYSHTASPPRKSFMVGYPQAYFSADGPILQSLSLSNDKFGASNILDYRRSVYLSGQMDPFLYGFAYPDMYHSEMIYFVEFDIAREYIIYFPNGNYTQIVKSIKTKRVKITNQKTKLTDSKKQKLNQTMSNLTLQN